MGYTTQFRGEFKIEPALKPEDLDWLQSFVRERHGGNFDADPGMPGLYCQWDPSEDGTSLAWDGNEKFYNYVEWLQYLVDHFFKPRGYDLSGTVRWRGEEFDDTGTIEMVGHTLAVEGTPGA